MLGILYLTSFILTLRAVVVANLSIPDLFILGLKAVLIAKLIISGYFIFNIFDLAIIQIFFNNVIF